MRLSRSAEHMPVDIGNPNEFNILECAQVVLEATGSKSELCFEPLPRSIPPGAASTSPRPASCWDGSLKSSSRKGCKKPSRFSGAGARFSRHGAAVMPIGLRPQIFTC